MTQLAIAAVPPQNTKLVWGTTQGLTQDKWEKAIPGISLSVATEWKSLFATEEDAMAQYKKYEGDIGRARAVINNLQALGITSPEARRSLDKRLDDYMEKWVNTDLSTPSSITHPRYKEGLILGLSRRPELKGKGYKAVDAWMNDNLSLSKWKSLDPKITRIDILNILARGQWLSS